MSFIDALVYSFSFSISLTPFWWTLVDTFYEAIKDLLFGWRNDTDDSKPLKE